MPRLVSYNGTMQRSGRGRCRGTSGRNELSPREHVCLAALMQLGLSLAELFFNTFHVGGEALFLDFESPDFCL